MTGVWTYHFLWEDFFQIQCAMWHGSFLIYFGPSTLSYRSNYLNSITLIDIVTNKNHKFYSEVKTIKHITDNIKCSFNNVTTSGRSIMTSWEQLVRIPRAKWNAINRSIMKFILAHFWTSIVVQCYKIELLLMTYMS